MDDVALRSLTQWFRSYVDRFRRDSDTLHPMMELKFAHTARVALLGRTIAELSGWTACEANLAEAAGWLHDVGRFSQWADFATYRDRISVDHASRGCEVLGREDVLSVASAQDRDYLMEAVALHNRLTLPDTLSPASRALCALVRDADKLDIFDLVCAHLDDGTLADLVPLLSAV
ncbi:MAG: HD domain-containing protein, partial [Polyangiaceae bacterium]|nr:HD domain-containing protein [Polyangiaceae bacterium]